MPKKQNAHGEMQNYIPKGNGDASGEYADESESNKHFQSFFRPSKEEKPITNAVHKERKTVISDYVKGNNDVAQSLGRAISSEDNDRILSNLDKLGSVSIEYIRGTEAFQGGTNVIRLKKSSSDGAKYHEIGHSIDCLAGKAFQNNGMQYNWISNDLDDEINEYFKSELPSNLSSKFDELRGNKEKRLREYTKSMEYSLKLNNELKKELQKYDKRHWDMAKKLIASDVVRRVLNDFSKKSVTKDEEKWTCLSDICDAVYAGTKKKHLFGGHEAGYYSNAGVVLQWSSAGNSKKRNTEIMANYIEMRLGGYEEQLKALKVAYPKLERKLSSIYSILGKEMEKL